MKQIYRLKTQRLKVQDDTPYAQSLDGQIANLQTLIDGNRKLPRKPAPDTFLLAAQMLGVDPADCIVFEDSLAGIEAAANAGMPVVAVGGIRSEKAILHIPDFRDIRKYFG